mmetsp:Transcript_6904/g.17313  ORF Transcript_6904/g.17313 Transcript_6904/m.17313 type:complete len:89 (+) Transcript_6904:1577-1843(+)
MPLRYEASDRNLLPALSRERRISFEKKLEQNCASRRKKNCLTILTVGRSELSIVGAGSINPKSKKNITAKLEGIQNERSINFGDEEYS